MKKIVIRLKHQDSFSINQAYYKGSFTRTMECRKWSENVLNTLKEPLNKHIISKNKEWVQNLKGIKLKLIFYVPHNIMFKKDGRISSRKQDLSNIEKLLIDLLFNEKYGHINFNIDDKYITKLISEQRPSNDYEIIVEVSEDGELEQWKSRFFPTPVPETPPNQSSDS